MAPAFRPERQQAQLESAEPMVTGGEFASRICDVVLVYELDLVLARLGVDCLMMILRSRRIEEVTGCATLDKIYLSQACLLNESLPGLYLGLYAVDLASLVWQPARPLF